MDCIQTYSCDHFYTVPQAEKVVMTVCKCCVKEMGCPAIVQEEEDVPSKEVVEEIVKIDTRWPKNLQRMQVPEVRPIVAPEPAKAAPKVVKKIPEKPIIKSLFPVYGTSKKGAAQPGDDKVNENDKEEKPKSNSAKDALMRLCVDEENKKTEIASAPPAPQPTKPKSKLKAAVAKALEPKKEELPERPVTPPIIKQYKPLPDRECSGMSIEEVRLAVEILRAKIEHDKKMDKWNFIVLQMENKLDRTIIQKDRAILKDRQLN